MDFRKKVKPKQAQTVTVRELVTKWGDDWALLAPSDSGHWRNVHTDHTRDFYEEAVMRLYEKGVKSRIRAEDVL